MSVVDNAFVVRCAVSDDATPQIKKQIDLSHSRRSAIGMLFRHVQYRNHTRNTFFSMSQSLDSGGRRGVRYTQKSYKYMNGHFLILTTGMLLSSRASSWKADHGLPRQNEPHPNRCAATADVATIAAAAAAAADNATDLLTA